MVQMRDLDPTPIKRLIKFLNFVDKKLNRRKNERVECMQSCSKTKSMLHSVFIELVSKQLTTACLFLLDHFRGYAKLQMNL